MKTTCTIKLPEGLHPDSAILIQRFAEVLANKMYQAQTKYGYTNEWKFPNWEFACKKALLEHLQKGDPRDVATYCAFMWHHNWRTTPEAV